MKTVTKTSFLATMVSVALAISCLGITGCGSDDADVTEATEGVSEASNVSWLNSVYADWNTPGYYEYQNEDPSSPFQKFTVVVTKHDMIEDLSQSNNLKTDIVLSISPYLNPDIYEIYQDYNPGIFNVDKVISGNLSLYTNFGTNKEKQAEVQNKILARFGEDNLSDVLENVDHQELMNYLIEEGLVSMQYDAKDMVMSEDSDYMYTYFTLEFPVTDLNDFTHLTLTNAFCYDEAKELKDAFSFDFRDKEEAFEDYDFDIETFSYYKEPLHFTCVSFKPIDVKTDEEIAQEEANQAVEDKAALMDFNQRMAEEMR